MSEWRLNRGVTEQTNAFLKGLFEVVEPSWLQVFDERELEVRLIRWLSILGHGWEHVVWNLLTRWAVKRYKKLSW